VRHHAFPNEDVIKDAFPGQDPALLRILSLWPASEVVRVYHPTVSNVSAFALRLLVANKLVKPRYTDPGPSPMVIVIVIADVKEVVAVIKHADSGQSAL
jgi:hypothetical protein